MSEQDFIYDNTIEDDKHHDNPNASIWPHAIRYGLIWGLVSAVVLLVSYFTGALEQSIEGSITASLFSGVVSIGIAIWLVYSAIKSYREDKGSLTFGNAVAVGAVTGLVYGIIAAIWTFIFYSFIFPDFFDIMLEVQATSLEDLGYEDDIIEQQLEMIRIFSNPVTSAISSIPMGVIAGTLLSLVIGIFTKTD